MNIRSITRFFFLGIFIIMSCFTNAGAQNSGFFMEIRGRAVLVDDNGTASPLQGAKITVYQNGKVYNPEKPGKKWKNPVITNIKGDVEFDLPYNAQYKIMFEKEGYLTMHLLIDGKITKGKDNQYYGYGDDWPFFKTDDKSFDSKKYNYPFTKVYFDPMQKNLVDDTKYMTEFTSGIIKEMQADEKRILAEKEAFEKAEREKKAAAKIERLKNAKEEIKNFIKISATITVFNKKWKPMINKKIELVNSKGEVVETTRTNELGGFAFTLLKPDENFLVRLSEPDPSLPANTKIMITNKKGKEINSTTLDAQGKMKLELLPADMTTLSLMNIDDENKTLLISGILLSGDGSKKPLEGSKVNLVNSKGLILKTITTNSKGEFEFSSLSADQNYMVSLDASGISSGNILLADKKGNEIRKLKADAAGKFEFRMLVADNKTLSYIQVEDSDLRTELAGLLFATGSNGQPLANIAVQLLNDKDEIIQTVKTDEKGKFVFSDLTSEYYYTLKIDSKDPLLKSLKGIILKDVNNNPVIEFEKTGDSFKYGFLSAEENKIEYNYTDDPWLKVLHLKEKNVAGANNVVSTTKVNDYSLKETVYFKPNDATLQPDAKNVLDKVIGVLETLQDITIELSSHTDSRGSDPANMILSQKRAKAAVDYIVTNGIPANRIVGKGYGETKLVNRCANGVICSEDEHAQNRRIEFVVKVK